MKPILFNTDMVRAILDGRKTVTRRVVKPQPPSTAHVAKVRYSWCWSWWEDSDSHEIKPPHHPGDILYVRETWQHGFGGTYLYRADAGHDLFMTPEGELVSDIPWRPSIHMPREAARIFLRVTDVRVERLQDITYEDCLREGITDDEINERDAFRPVTSARWLYAHLWNSTIKPANRVLYTWSANPWVWVIEFERISKEEALRNADST